MQIQSSESSLDLKARHSRPSSITPPQSPKKQRVSNDEDLSNCSKEFLVELINNQKKIIAEQKVIIDTQKRIIENGKKTLTRRDSKISSLQTVLVQSQDFVKSYKKLKDIQKEMVDLLLKNAKSSTGIRYTWDQKIIALSIYKKSPKCYRFLRTLISLPSIATLKNELAKIPIGSGINNAIKNRLKEAAGFIEERDKVAVLLWDEVHLSMHLDYDEKKGRVTGFEEWGKDATSKLADHALAFMLRGLNSGWKIPLAYGFTSGSVPAVQLQKAIKDVVVLAKEAGILIVATVCDQGATNQKAIHDLVKQTDRQRDSHNLERYGTMLVHGVEIIPLFDGPHIFKCIRNNLLTKDLEFYADSNEKKVISWDVIDAAYRISKSKSLKYFPKLTDDHVFEGRMKKMRVKYAFQVMSHSVASGIRKMLGNNIRWAYINDENVTMPTNSHDTADGLEFFDELIDALNGQAPGAHRTYQKCLMSESSYHATFLRAAKGKLHSMRWINKKTGAPEAARVPTLQNLINTIDGILLLWKKLKSFGFTQLNLRYVNQDPLENFFGQIRSQGDQNTSPTPAQFSGSFKSLLIQNLMSDLSIGANCMDDGGEFLLSWASYGVESLEDTPSNAQASTIVSPFSKGVPDEEEMYADFKSTFKQNADLISCEECNYFVCSRFSSSLYQILADSRSLMKSVLPGIFSDHLCRKKAAMCLEEKLNFDAFTCKIHIGKIRNIFIESVIKSYLSGVVKHLDNILRRKITVDDASDIANPIERQVIERSEKALKKSARRHQGKKFEEFYYEDEESWD